MAAYLPPTENVAIFDSLLFQSEDDALTYAQASKLFLTFPYAQGTENLQAINVAGVAEFGNKVGQTIAGTGNVQYGDSSSLALRTTGDYNTCIGTHTGDAITTSSKNTIIGSFAGDSISTGVGENTLIGKSAGHVLSTGITNTLIGCEVAQSLTTGNDNIAIGKNALNQCTTGYYNISIGDNSLQTSAVGINNIIAIGQNAGRNQQASGNIYIGQNAGNSSSISAGLNTVGIGLSAGRQNQSSNGIAIGNGAGQTTQGTGAIAIGLSAGNSAQATRSVAIGQNAGTTTQQTLSVAVGDNAGNDNQESSCVAIGSSAGQTTQRTQAIAIGRLAGNNVQGTASIAIGNTAGQTSQGINSVAIGSGSGNTNQQGGGVAIGLNAGNDTQGINGVAIGNNAGNSNQSSGTVAIGENAGQTSQGQYGIAIGVNSGVSSQVTNAVAIGRAAGNSSQGDSAIGIGYSAGRLSQASSAVAIGKDSGYQSQGSQSIAIGIEAGKTTQGGNSVAIGDFAGTTTQGASSIAIGDGASFTNQGTRCISIGNGAGYSDQQTQGIAIGTDAGRVTQGTNSIAIGNTAGRTTQGLNSIAIGSGAGNTSQALNSVAIGQNAGNTSQATRSVAIGNTAGQTSQGQNSVAVGYGAGTTSQGQNSVAVGYGAGTTTQSLNSVAVGQNAGNSGQGGGSLALGYKAGETNLGINSMVVSSLGLTQDNTNTNTIVINASTAAITTSQNSALYVAPIRNVVGTDVLYYDNATKEVTYGASGVSAPLTLTQAAGGTANPIITSITTDAANNGAFNKLYKNSASPAANDVVGGLYLTSNDSLGVEREVGSITYICQDPTAGTFRNRISVNCVTNSGSAEVLGYQSVANSTFISNATSNIFFYNTGAKDPRFFLGDNPATANTNAIYTSGSGLRTDVSRIAGTGSCYKYRVAGGTNPNADTNNVLEMGVTTANTLNYLTIGNTTTPANTTVYGDVTMSDDITLSNANPTLIFTRPPTSAGLTGSRRRTVAGHTLDEIQTSATGALYTLRGRVNNDPSSGTYNILQTGVTTADALNFLTIGNTSIPTNTTFYGESIMQNTTGGINNPLLTIRTTDAGPSGAFMKIYKLTGSPAASDDIGGINFTSRNNSAVEVDYARITARIEDSSTNNHNGSLAFMVVVDNSAQEIIRIGGNGITNFNTDTQMKRVYQNNIFNPINLYMSASTAAVTPKMMTYDPNLGLTSKAISANTSFGCAMHLPKDTYTGIMIYPTAQTGGNSVTGRLNLTNGLYLDLTSTVNIVGGDLNKPFKMPFLSPVVVSVPDLYFITVNVATAGISVGTSSNNGYSSFQSASANNTGNGYNLRSATSTLATGNPMTQNYNNTTDLFWIALY